MTSSLEFQAVQEALKNNWEKAIGLNKEIIKENPRDIPALNRLARAYKELGNLKKCKATYRKVLTLDKYNPIASKNLKRLGKSSLKQRGAGSCQTAQNDSLDSPFLEEPGKTKLVHLINLAPASILLEINPLNKVQLSPKKHTILVKSDNGKYLGALPDDLSKRIITLIKGGNRYSAFVKSVDKKDLTIIIREIHKSARFKNQPSFAPLKPLEIPKEEKPSTVEADTEEEVSEPGEEVNI